MTASFTVVMPMKAWDRAKSRLHVEPATRRALAEAFARDTLAAVLACPAVGEVVVVTRGDLVVDAVRDAGAHVIQEPADRPLDTLGSAIRHGIAWAADHRPHAPLAVVPSDLPGPDPRRAGRAAGRSRCTPVRLRARMPTATAPRS